ncbi:MAG: DUF1297 domain-containing protein [bacterium]|nr:DUF1297 domain-containing protein [bacterium]
MNNKINLKQYSNSNVTIATLGSHSALDICRGAKDEGFKTLVVCEKGKEKTYNQYFNTKNNNGCVDECIVLNKFDEILKPDIQKKLISKNAIFLPHRSFEVYLHFNYKAIEQDFNVSIFGNKYLLKIEERGTKPNQYDLLKSSGIRYPLQFKDPKDIDRLCLVKVLEKERKFERAFFLVKNYKEYKKIVEEKLQKGIFTEEQLDKSVTEEFVLGTQVNFNYFYSPVNNRLELLGTDMRRQTNIEGLLRLPSIYQTEVMEKISVQYEEAGHIAVTVLESILEKVFEMGERFVKAAKDSYLPGVVGPFALQSIIIPGPPKKDIVVIDVSPRMPGSPGISSTPYSKYLFGESLSVGRRVAIEIKNAIKLKKLNKILT